MHQLQNFISQKLIKRLQRNFQRVFLYTYTAIQPDLHKTSRSPQLNYARLLYIQENLGEEGVKTLKQDLMSTS
jgi:hypothetical protein